MYHGVGFTLSLEREFVVMTFQLPTNLFSILVVSGSGVGHVIIIRFLGHCFCDAATELGHMRTDVAEESITFYTWMS
jgi:hypothetical protein